MLVFVYGTLKKGYKNHSVLQRAKFIGEAQTVDKFTLYKGGNIFPFLFEKSSEREHKNIILGELYDVPESMIPALDHFEGVPLLFDRKEIKIKCNENVEFAQCYFINNTTGLTFDTIISKY